MRGGVCGTSTGTWPTGTGNWTMYQANRCLAAHALLKDCVIPWPCASLMCAPPDLASSCEPYHTAEMRTAQGPSCPLVTRQASARWVCGQANAAASHRSVSAPHHQGGRPLEVVQVARHHHICACIDGQHLTDKGSDQVGLRHALGLAGQDGRLDATIQGTVAALHQHPCVHNISASKTCFGILKLSMVNMFGVHQ